MLKYYLLSFFLVCTGITQAQSYTHIELHPSGQHYTRTYDLHKDHLVVMDVWDDSRDTLVKVMGFNAQQFLNSPNWAKLPDSISQKCTEPDEPRFQKITMKIYAIGKDPRRIVFYQTAQPDIVALCKYINILLEQKPEYRIGVDFEKYRKLKAACNQE